MSAPPLSASATSALQAAVILLRDTRGFMFLPLFADSERAASSGLDFLKSELTSEFYTVAWPLDRALPLGDQRLQLLGNLDDAIGKLPPDTVIVLDATGSLRHDLALEVIAYVNHRREPLKASGLRLVLCWPAAFKDELLSNAPDLWSVRAASPWVEVVDLPLTKDAQTLIEMPSLQAGGSPISVEVTEKLKRWQRYRDLKMANLSPRDALDLANFQYSNLQWASAAELAEAVFNTVQSQKNILIDSQALIDALNFLSIARAQLGNLTGALEASRLAVHSARQLAKINPEAYEANLAMSMNNLANRLAETGNLPLALSVSQETADIYRRLTEDNPTLYQPDLALSQNNLANRLSQTGNYIAALLAAEAAADIFRQLFKTNPDIHAPSLAASLGNLSNALSEAGDQTGSQNAAQEAVALYKSLAKSNPEAYEPNLAACTNNFANRLSDTGNYAAALLAAQDAVEIVRRLVKKNPAAYENNLAGCLSNLASQLSATGDNLGAKLPAQEAVEIRKRITKSNPIAYEADLAMSINTLANVLSKTGDPINALRAAKEAVVLYESANQQTPKAFERQLAIAKRVLDDLSKRQILL